MEDNGGAQANDDGGRSERVLKSWDATRILRAQPTGIADRLKVEYEKGVKEDASIYA